MPTLASRQRLLLGCIAGTFVTAAVAAPQSSPPDFSLASSDTGWVALGGDFLPVAGSPTPLVQDPAHPFVGNNTGAQPTYRIADLSHSNLKPWVKERMKKDNDEVLAGKIAYTARSSCRPAGIPDFMMFVINPVYFIQSPKEVLMIYAGDQQLRRVYLDVPHTANPKPSYYGESVGHYEGDTLVVDTIGYNEGFWMDRRGSPTTEKLHTLEKFTRTNSLAIHYETMVDDPGAYTKSWTNAFDLRWENGTELFEYVCQQMNYAPTLMVGAGKSVDRTTPIIP